MAFIQALPNRIYGIMTNDLLIAVPLFVFMGVMLERSKIAEELLDTMAHLLGSVKGGLGISVTIVGALLAASTGIVVDVLYLNMSERKRAIVDLFGSLFLLLPVCWVIFYYSWSYVINSWVQMEGSIEERGLHLVFIMKTFIWLFSFLVSLQSIATIINSFHIIKSSKKG